MTIRRASALAATFVLVHAILIAENVLAPNGPLGDVQWTYPAWWVNALATGTFPGLSAIGVYPFVSLIPIAIAAAGIPAWFLFVVIVDAVALVVIAHRHETAAYVWLTFQLALGPIAVGRIDFLTVALGVCAVALIDRSPRMSGSLVALATWVKVWPIVLGLAFLRSPRFGILARWSFGVALGIAVLGILVGDRASVFSFLTQQQGRGIQVESVAATPWLWDAWAGGGSAITYAADILTFEITGLGTETVAGVLTLVQLLFLAGVMALMLATRRSVGPVAGASLGYALFAMVSLLIVANKVGSPQFVAWLAVPLVALVIESGPRPPTVIISVSGIVAVLTHLVYPYVYFSFLELRTVPLALLTARNLAEVVLLVLSLWALVTQLRVEKLAKQFADLGIGDEKRVVTER